MIATDSGPYRTCVACRESLPKKKLIRYVIGPDAVVLVDYRQRLPGRGVYTCFKLSCIDAAVKRQAFKRGFRQQCEVAGSAELKKQIEMAVEKKTVSLIGMARKAGEIVTGTNAVIDFLNKPQAPGLILVAEDISATIGEKIRQLAQRKNIYYVCMFSKETIGQLLGKHERSAIALEKGALASTLKFELQRFEQL